MLKNSLISLTQTALAAAAVLTFSHSAMAATFSNYNCSETIGGRAVQVVATVITGSSYDVKVTVDGKDVPVSGGHCFESNRPSTKYVLCTFHGADFELDLYPWTQTTSGAIRVMQYVWWNGENSSQPAQFSNCTSK